MFNEVKIPISEIFFSIQGEGINIGKPAIFLRLYYCNLYCEWCDTKYTWVNQKNAKEGIDYKNFTVGEILSEIKKYPAKHVVITGGEPLIFQKHLLPLVKLLRMEKYYVEIETNGTIKPLEELVRYVDNFSVSPKLNNSKVSHNVRIKANVLEFFSNLDNAFFKFVICDKNDIIELESLIRQFNINKEKVILMPEGTEIETLKDRSLWITEYCKKNSYRFSPRLHILIYGNKRGI